MLYHKFCILPTQGQTMLSLHGLLAAAVPPCVSQALRGVQRNVARELPPLLGASFPASHQAYVLAVAPPLSFAQCFNNP